MLFMAFGHQPYAFYQTLRMVVFCEFLWIAYQSAKPRGIMQLPDEGYSYALISSLIFAAAFNPFMPLHIPREAWQVIDGIAIIKICVFTISNFKQHKIWSRQE